MTGPADPLDDLPDLIAAVTALTDEVARQDRRGKWNRRLIWMLAVITAGMLALGFFTWRNSAYSVCASNRSQALAAPGNERVDLFLQAYNEAAGAVHTPLTAGQRARIITGLDNARRQFTVIPDHGRLIGQPDSELLGLRDLIASLRANARYQTASAQHPVCSLWSL